MVQLKNYKGDVSDLSLSFAVDEDDLGVSHTVDLVPGGRDVPVTNENRNAYIARVCHYHLNIRIREQCAAFVSGLQEIINPRWLRLFSVSELRTLVEGTDQPVDVEDLRANTVYAGVDESSETITYFWSVLSEMDASERKAFLRFVTSADKVRSRPDLHPEAWANQVLKGTPAGLQGAKSSVWHPRRWRRRDKTTVSKHMCQLAQTAQISEQADFEAVREIRSVAWLYTRALTQIITGNYSWLSQHRLDLTFLDVCTTFM